MAKLSAHGTEIVRVEHTWIPKPGECDYERVKTSYAFMSDGHILKKLDHLPDVGEKHYGEWKTYKRLKDVKGLPAETIASRQRAYAERTVERSRKLIVPGKLTGEITLKIKQEAS